MNPFVRSSGVLTDRDELCNRADRDSYLFLANLLDGESILRVRRDITRVLAEAGWIEAGTDPMSAFTSHEPLVSGQEGFKPVYDAVQRLESFHTLAHDPAILDVAAQLLGEPGLLQPSNIARFIFPTGLDYTTPAHQDYVHIQWTPDVWTVWVPLGDCPAELGGLELLRGSHKGGVLPVHKALGAGGLGIDEEARSATGSPVRSSWETCCFSTVTPCTADCPTCRATACGSQSTTAFREHPTRSWNWCWGRIRGG